LFHQVFFSSCFSVFRQDASSKEVEQLQGCLLQNLNAPVTDPASLATKEKCMQLLATLALQKQNAGWVLGALQQLDGCFEKLFESEELYSNGTAIGTTLLNYLSHIIETLVPSE
jgi:hypothetical protein